MEEHMQFIHSKVLVTTHDALSYKGILLAIDQYLNIVLQDAKPTTGTTKGAVSMFLKGSNILHIALDRE
ncbi:U6 snRNA-associated Sm-like protein LSm6 [Nematocida displodere]|uniref:U6 snRNA-associated Sm-like protein LSm6 n=1 Tax=Nematocida displodere TaxID=1805483 RepID=A0A177EDE2_9MICR|nr:U6 snRNA-associated Sm-like protein LSm6 [Nematocida displodere]